MRYQHASEIRADLKRLKRDADSGYSAAASDTAQPVTPVMASSQEKKSEPASQSGIAEKPHRSKWKIVVPVAALVAALIAGGLYWRSHKTVKLTDKDTIVLADFTNTTGDPVFDGTLRQGLAVQLEQSPLLSLATEQQIQQVLTMMKQSPDAKFTPEIAREVCQRSGGTAVIAGSIASLGSQYVVGLKAVNCRTGILLAEQQLTANGKEQILKVLGDAAAKLREDLGESLSTVHRNDIPLEQASTPSLEALQAYSMGRESHIRRQDETKSVFYYKRATELDPNFATAQASLGMAYAILGQESLAMDCIRKAYELRDRVSERERLFIESAFHRIVTGDLLKDIQVEELRVQANPREYIALVNLSLVYMNLGQYDKALETSRQAYKLNPGTTWMVYSRLVSFNLFLNRLDEARTIAKEAEAKNLDSPAIHYWVYQLAFVQNDNTLMSQQVTWAEANQEMADAQLDWQAATLAFTGQLQKARDLSLRAEESAVRRGSIGRGRYIDVFSGYREALIGNRYKAQSFAAKGMGPESGRRAQAQAALVFALAGDSTRAEGISQDLTQQFPEDTLLQSIYLPEVRAQIALNRKDPSKAIELLRAAAYEMGSVACLFPAYMRGQAYLRENNGNDASVEFQKIVNHREIVQNDIIGALAHLELGRAYAMQGNPTKAKAAYQEFLTLWKDADPDIPILKQAKAEYAKLE